jgi:hypothetical protein
VPRLAKIPILPPSWKPATATAPARFDGRKSAMAQDVSVPGSFSTRIEPGTTPATSPAGILRAAAYAPTSADVVGPVPPSAPVPVAQYADNADNAASEAMAEQPRR